MTTFTPQIKNVDRQWHFFDAKDQVLGRMATQIAVFLMGKHKPTFARHLDWGDHVVVINAEQVVTTGRKETQKIYTTHSGYPGGLKQISLEKQREIHPDRVIIHAVSGMLPDNKLKAGMLKRLHVFAGRENPFAQHFK